jgi:hypothetical protein
MDAYEEMEETLEWAAAAGVDENATDAEYEALMDKAAREAVIAQAQQMKRIADALERIAKVAEIEAALLSVGK